ncbi:MAG: class IV adenylate cyclase [Candidatus Paceibacterota bacterium]
MKEIEVKAHLTNEKEVIKKLQTLGCTLSKAERQIDTVYSQIIGGVGAYNKNDHFLRIREKSDGRFIFTVKKPLSRDVLTKAEHETEIKDPKELEQALFLMGYKIASKVIKTRRKTHFKEFEICLDEVEGLGAFIEIERLSREDVDLVRRELDEFLASLGITRADQIHKGYDILEIEKRLG